MVSQAFKAFVTDNAKVLDWYHDGEYYDVRLNGHCDEGDHGRHIIMDTRASEVMKRIKKATPCKCGQCPTKN
jgi:hypothetical protein